MHTQRLEILAAALDADAANPEGMTFDLGLFGRSRDYGRPALNCNTKGCAIGVALLTPALAEQGFTPEPEMLARGQLNPIFNGCHKWAAITRFFEIDLTTALHLFVERCYAVSVGAEAERAVAARIRAVLAGERPSERAKLIAEIW